MSDSAGAQDAPTLEPVDVGGSSTAAGTELDLDVPDRPPIVARLATAANADLVAAVLAGLAPAILLHEILGWRGVLGTAVWW
jgi:hypothetical protein